MECKCLSRPKYHRDDCPNFHPDGEPKNHYEFEKLFNERLEEQVGDVIPFYFRFRTHSSFYRAIPYNRISGEEVSIDEVHEYIKEHMKVLCEKFFENTGNHVTYN